MHRDASAPKHLQPSIPSFHRQSSHSALRTPNLVQAQSLASSPGPAAGRARPAHLRLAGELESGVPQAGAHHHR